ncbi:MAG: hypothetical protein H0U75_06895 [Legionella sp.]|nr:hypothetical protein [Legionella sp.]
MIEQVKLFENHLLNWQEIKIPLQLNKDIFLGRYHDEHHLCGHFSDYLKGTQPYVALRAHKDTQLVLWDSSALIRHCLYNDALSVSFHMPLESKAEVMKVETWQGNNGFILRKSKRGYDLTYYFSLLHSHAITGELSVSPCFYFIENELFTLSPDVYSHISELFKTKQIRLDIKKNQVLCFDKFHYQVQYNPDFSCIQLGLL